MLTETLFQILLIIGIIAGIMLVVTLWKFGKVLDDFKETSTIAKKRVKQLDKGLDSAEEVLNNFTSVVKGFLASFETGQKLKNKIKNFWD